MTEQDVRTPAAPEVDPASVLRHRPRSLWHEAWQRLRAHRAATVSLLFIVALLVVAVAAPLVAPYAYDQTDFARIGEGPSRAHWLGTDALGRDVLSRVIYGSRVSLSVAFIAQFVIISIGVPVGLTSAYFGGWLDLVTQRVVDVLYSFPPLLFVIVVMTYLRPTLQEAEGPVAAMLARVDGATGGLTGVLLGLGLVMWLTVARLVRGQVLSLKQQEFVQAARSVGCTNLRIMRKHILPNTLAPVIVAATFGIPIAIMIEAGLSFLGLGAQPPTPSWGMMISEGVDHMRSDPVLLVAPGLALALTLLAFNFVGDGLRDALDPYVYD